MFARRSLRPALAALALAPLFAGGRASAQQLFRLSPLDGGGAADDYGHSVAMEGRLAVIGDPMNTLGFVPPSFHGSAYVVDTQTGQQLHRVFAPDAEALDTFGWSVAVSGSRVAAGAPRDDDLGNNSGSVYLFNADTGQFTVKLNASDGLFNDQFGYAVALSDTRVFVGAPFHDLPGDGDAGAVYVFDVATGQQLMKWTAAQPDVSARFGLSLAVHGDRVLVGAPLDDEVGAAYVFDATTGAELHKLVASDGASVDRFGTSVALDDSLAVCGAPTTGTPPTGGVYVFDLASGAELQKLPSSPLQPFDAFGTSVALSDGLLAVGAPGTASLQGSAFLFQLDPLGVGPFESVPFRQVRDDEAPLPFEDFGTSVAVAAGRVLVGSPDDVVPEARGSAFLFGPRELGQDCNGNGRDDGLETWLGEAEDCDRDGIPNLCEADCNGDGILDDCQVFNDCDGNGVPDSCDIDCNGDGVPDDCQGGAPDCNGNGLPDCEEESDCDGDGVPDECEPDCTGDGVPDPCGPDCSGDGVPDACEPDCDGDGVPDPCETDCDGSGTPDDCEGLADCDGNGVPDVCSLDCDLDGVPDACQGAADCDEDGVPDVCEPDCDANGVPDVCEGAGDCNGDGVLDPCEPDCDGDSLPDACERDCNGDGVPDDCQGAGDCNGDGIPNACEADQDFDGVPDVCEAFSTYCYGGPCPCGNESLLAGCTNSTGAGATLRATGSASVSANDLVLTARFLPPGNVVVLFAADTISPPSVFGDGGTCTSGLSHRYPVTTADAFGTAVIDPVVTGAPADFLVPGVTRGFQAFYRDVLCGPPPSPCPTPCGDGANLTDGLRVVFEP